MEWVWGRQLFLAQKHMLGNVAAHQVMMWRGRKVSRPSASQCPAKSMETAVSFFPPPLYLLSNLAEEEIVLADKGRGGSRTQLLRIWLRHGMTRYFVVGLIVPLLCWGPPSIFPSFHI